VRALCAGRWSWRSIGRWATIALIVSGIMSPVLAVSETPLLGSISGLVSLNNHFVTEFRPMSWGAGERIIIICPAPYKDTATRLCRNQFFSTDYESKSSSPRLWGDKRLAGSPLIQITEIEMCRNIPVENVHTRVKGHILCRGVTGVLQCNGADNPCDLTVDRNPCYGKGSDGDISALFRDHDFSGIKRLTIGDFLYRNYGLSKLRG
jgi:hypothetical protein